MVDQSTYFAHLPNAPESGDLEVVEIPLLLTGGQVAALEIAAHARGLSAAELLRSVLRRFIDTLPAAHQALREA